MTSDHDTTGEKIESSNTDIDETRRTEEALKRALSELERRVEERTRELTEANEALRKEIDEHLRAVRLLREQQERFEFIARATNDLVYDWDIPSDLVWFNEAVESLLGYPGGKVSEARERWLRLVHPQDRDWLQKRFEKFRDSGQQLWSAEYRIQRKDGSYITLFDQAYLIYDERGNPRRFVGTASDISERVQAEEARKKLLQGVVAAHEEERKRVARELHDQLSQQLIALNLGLEHLKGYDSMPAVAVEKVKELQRILDDLTQEVSRIEHNLHPAALEGAELHEAIRSYVEQWSERTGLPLNSDFNLDEEELSLPVKTCLYRIIQEALTNIYKHSGARQATLVLEQRGGEVVLIIEDDGVGFNLSEVQESSKGGLGLRSMRERVELLGGHFEIESSPRQGTSVFARLPLGQAEGG